MTDKIVIDNLSQSEASSDIVFLGNLREFMATKNLGVEDFVKAFSRDESEAELITKWFTESKQPSRRQLMDLASFFGITQKSQQDSFMRHILRQPHYGVICYAELYKAALNSKNNDHALSSSNASASVNFDFALAERIVKLENIIDQMANLAITSDKKSSQAKAQVEVLQATMKDFLANRRRLIAIVAAAFVFLGGLSFSAYMSASNSAAVAPVAVTAPQR